MEKIGIELKWAAFITIFSCLWAALEKALGYHEDFSNILVITFIYYVLLTFLWAFAFIDKKRSLGKGADWPFTKAFKFGLFVTGLLTILNPISQYIIYQSISPDYFENVIKYQLSKGNQTRADLEMIHNMEFAIRQGIMNVLSLGVIFAALYAWVFKTKTVPVNENKSAIKNKK